VDHVLLVTILVMLFAAVWVLIGLLPCIWRPDGTA
jgi:hypothetical protein